VDNTIRIPIEKKFKTAIIVSQFYHITRTKMFFRKSGFKNISSVSPMYFEIRDLYSLFREFFAYYWALVI
ncbi:YdcF family protein, partial [Pseudomonas silesiensis]